jgi:mRNA-degrading endonuclease RelE of RelBE toxin-antitoxin system
MRWPKMQSISMHVHCFVTTRLHRSLHLFLVCDGVARYKILLKVSVVREYEAIAAKTDRRRVLWTIAALTIDPRPAVARKLPERQDHLRIYTKHHRVIYQIDDIQRQVTVFRIAYRGRQDSTWQSSASGPDSG